MENPSQWHSEDLDQNTISMLAGDAYIYHQIFMHKVHFSLPKFMVVLS